jgi:acyl-CoA thioesterase-2
VTVAADELLALLDLEPTAPDTYLGWCREGAAGRVFGGHLAAQALLAAGRTTEPAKTVHSLHANFVHRGRPTEQVRYHVERLRDSRSFSTRRVTATQGKHIVLQMSASFHVTEVGTVDHHLDRPVTAPPDEAPALFGHPIEVRPVRWSPSADAIDQRLPEQHLWVRSPAALPDDPLVHAGALVFASDITVGWAPWKVVGIHRVTPGMFGASLDHAMWFHRPFRADEWLLVHQASPSASAGRGLSLAQVYDTEGRLVVTVAQEGVVRRRPEGDAPPL